MVAISFDERSVDESINIPLMMVFAPSDSFNQVTVPARTISATEALREVLRSEQFFTVTRDEAGKLTSFQFSGVAAIEEALTREATPSPAAEDIVKVPFNQSAFTACSDIHLLSGQSEKQTLYDFVADGALAYLKELKKELRAARKETKAAPRAQEQSAIPPAEDSVLSRITQVAASLEKGPIKVAEEFCTRCDDALKASRSSKAQAAVVSFGTESIAKVAAATFKKLEEKFNAALVNKWERAYQATSDALFAALTENTFARAVLSRWNITESAVKNLASKVAMGMVRFGREDPAYSAALHSIIADRIDQHWEARSVLPSVFTESYLKAEHGWRYTAAYNAWQTLAGNLPHSGDIPADRTNTFFHALCTRLSAINYFSLIKRTLESPKMVPANEPFLTLVKESVEEAFEETDFGTSNRNEIFKRFTTLLMEELTRTGRTPLPCHYKNDAQGRSIFLAAATLPLSGAIQQLRTGWFDTAEEKDFKEQVECALALMRRKLKMLDASSQSSSLSTLGSAQEGDESPRNDSLEFDSNEPRWWSNPFGAIREGLQAARAMARVLTHRLFAHFRHHY